MTFNKVRILLLLLASIVYLSACSQVRPPAASHPSQNARPYGSTNYPMSPQRSAVVTTAQRVIGSPYRWAGNTPKGFDCSGLTRYVYGSANIAIPRTAAQQRDNSKTLPNYSHLRPGDLIFFKTGTKTDHVGIYVGNGEFIHASTSQRRVIQTKLDTPYWRKHFVKFGTYL